MDEERGGGGADVTERIEPCRERLGETGVVAARRTPAGGRSAPSASRRERQPGRGARGGATPCARRATARRDAGRGRRGQLAGPSPRSRGMRSRRRRRTRPRRCPPRSAAACPAARRSPRPTRTARCSGSGPAPCTGSRANAIPPTIATADDGIEADRWTASASATRSSPPEEPPGAASWSACGSARSETARTTTCLPPSPRRASASPAPGPPSSAVLTRSVRRRRCTSAPARTRSMCSATSFAASCRADARSGVTSPVHRGPDRAEHLVPCADSDRDSLLADGVRAEQGRVDDHRPVLAVELAEDSELGQHAGVLLRDLTADDRLHPRRIGLVLAAGEGEHARAAVLDGDGRIEEGPHRVGHGEQVTRRETSE